MNLLTLGSLASGIGGLDLAVEAVFDTIPIWHAEYDKYADSVYSQHWNTPNLGDITKIDWSVIERPDILCGGYPCQPFSQVGLRKGEDDERNLWPYFARAIRALRPNIVVLENVAAHLRLGFGRVLGDLAEAGYDAEWGVFRASDVGAPHRRERIFIVAYTDGYETPIDPIGQGFQRQSDTRQGRFDFRDFGAAIRRWEFEMNESAPYPMQGKRVNPDFARWMMGYPTGWTHGSQTQQLKMIGNAVVPQQGEFAIRHLLARANKEGE